MILPVVGELPTIMAAIGDVAAIVTIVSTRLAAFVMPPGAVVSVLTRCGSIVMGIAVAVAVFGAGQGRDRKGRDCGGGQ